MSAAHTGRDPQGVVARAVGDRLAEHRPDGDAGVQGDRVVRRRLGPAVGRGEVLDGGGGADEHGRLADAGHQAQHEQHAEARGQRVAQHRQAHDPGPAHHEDAAAPPVAEPAGEGADECGRHGEQTAHDADLEAVAAELVLDERRERGHQHPQRGEVGERRPHDDEEAAGDEPLPGRRGIGGDHAVRVWQRALLRPPRRAVRRVQEVLDLVAEVEEAGVALDARAPGGRRRAPSISSATRPGPRRQHVDPLGQVDGLGHVVGDHQDRGAGAVPAPAAGSPASPAWSGRRGRRTARRAAGRRARGRGPGRWRPAGACRRTAARAVAGEVGEAHDRRAARRPAPRAAALAHPAHSRPKATFSATVFHGYSE